MYIPLYNKTTYSFLSSLMEVDDLINIAKENKLEYMAICDDNMFGVMEFIRKCLDNNLKPIIGLDLEDRLLFAKNYKGYQNLLKLTTIKSERELTSDDYKKYKNDLICIPLKDIELIYQDIFYPLNTDNENQDNVIYINKLLYKKEKDYEILKYLELLRDNLTIENEYTNKVGCYYKVVDGNKKALDNTFKLASLCDFKLPKYELNLAIYNKEIDSSDYLKSLSYKGLQKRLGGNIPKIYMERLNHELEVIIKMGFANYFLVVYDFIKYAKNKGILVGPGRGSAAGSLVSYTLGITDIDPLKYDLLFERFLNVERITMPDIDTDFPDIYREEVIKYVKEKYGEKRVANIITFGTMGAKLCVRDIGRVMNVDLRDIDRISKLIGTRKESLKEIIKSDIRIQELINNDNKIKKLMRVAVQVEGIKRQSGTHAAGIIISNQDLDEIVPLVYDNNLYISGYEASYLEDLGLLKMDFLGIKNLTTIMEILDAILTNEGKRIEFRDIPLDDKETIELFKKGDTNGIFQFESNGMKNFLRQLSPNNFNDIVSAIALFRPGCAPFIPTFIKRKEGLEQPNYYDKSLEGVLKSTYGIIIYQEQIMQIACIVGGYSLGEADILRRAMSKKKKEIIEEEHDKFIAGALNRGYSKELAEEIYNVILRFASYGFNKSHSIAYSIIAYKMAYLKVHYQKYFYISLLNSVISDNAKTKEYMYEMKKYHLNILKPDVNYSDSIYLIHDGKILAPFNIIKGISNIASSKIINEREEPYQDIYDFFAKTSSITESIYEILINAGALDSFGYNRRTLIENLSSLMNYSKLCEDLETEFVLKPEIEIKEEYDNLYLINKEKELYGFYMTNHPVLNYKLEFHDIINLEDIEKYFNKFGNFIVMVEKTREINTKTGEKMMFFTGSDEEQVRDFTMFPKTYKEYFDIKKGDILKIYGKVEKRNGGYQIIVFKLEKIGGYDEKN